MSRKRAIYIIAALGICLLLSVSVTSVCQAEKYVLNSISAWPQNTFMVQNFTMFMDRVNAKAAKIYPGELKIVYKGGPEVISFREQVEAVRTGLIDMVFTANAYYSSMIPAMDVFIATTLRPWEEREMGVYEFMEKVHAEKANAYFLTRIGSGIPFQIYVNKPVKSLADLKGMKLRCSPPIVPFLKAIGVNPVVMKPGDIYTALERGVVDGYVWPASQIREWGWEAVTKYAIFPVLPYMAADVILINLDVWNKLPNHLQEFLEAEAKEAEYRTVVRALEYMPREDAELQKLGIRFIQLPDADAKKMTDIATETIWAVINKKAPVNGPKLQAIYNKK